MLFPQQEQKASLFFITDLMHCVVSTISWKDYEYLIQVHGIMLSGNMHGSPLTWHANYRNSRGIKHLYGKLPGKSHIHVYIPLTDIQSQLLLL